MKRKEVLHSYAVHDGAIITPGKFAGEPIYAPHFHEAMLCGFASHGPSGSTTLEVLPADVEEFPELGNAHTITLCDDGDCVTTELHGWSQLK